MYDGGIFPCLRDTLIGDGIVLSIRNEIAHERQLRQSKLTGTEIENIDKFSNTQVKTMDQIVKQEDAHEVKVTSHKTRQKPKQTGIRPGTPSESDHRRPKLTFRESEKLIIYLFIYASRLCELERDLSFYAVLGYMRTVENLSAL